MRTGDPYSGPADISFTRPAHAEEKIFHVETKNAKVSLVDSSFLKTFARMLLKFSDNEEEFDYLIFAREYADESRWRYIFDGKRRKEEEVKRYWKRLRSDHGLTADEAQKFEQLDYQDFRDFIGIVDVNKAPRDRVLALTRQNLADDRPKKTFEFYTQEFDAIPDRTQYVPNVFRVESYPEHVWKYPAKTTDHRKALRQIPRTTPIWFDELDAYSLVAPDRLPDGSDHVLELDRGEELDFTEWAFDANEGPSRHLLTTLLNKRLLWRGVQLHDRCVAVRHRGEYKLIIKTAEETAVQQTLTRDSVEVNPDPVDEYEGYNIIRDMGRGVGHRYGHPQVRWYDDEPFVVIGIGWLFTRNGKGDSVITGDLATDLHHKLKQQTTYRTTNERAHFRQWRQYLRAGLQHGKQANSKKIEALGRSQQFEFREAERFELPVRPAKNSTEQRDIAEGRVP